MTASLQPVHDNPHLPTLGRLVQELDGSYPGYSMLDLATQVHWERAEIQTETQPGWHSAVVNAKAEGLGIEGSVRLAGHPDKEKANKFLPSGIRLSLLVHDSHSYRLKIICSVGPPSYHTYNEVILGLYRQGREVSFPLAGYPHKLRANGWLEHLPWRSASDIPWSPPEHIVRGRSNLGGAIASALLYVGLSFDWQKQKFLQPTIEEFRHIIAKRTKERTTID